MPNNDKLLTEEQIAAMESAGQVAPIEASPIIPGVNNGTGSPPTPSGRDQYNSGALPPNFGLQPDLVKTGYGGGVGEIRLMPIEGGPGANAKTAGIATAIVKAAIAGLPGPSTDTDTSAGDGLTHGDPIWDVDSAVFWMRDDFVPAVSLTDIGQLGWDVTLGTGGASGSYSGTPPHFGIYYLQSGTVSSQTASLFFSSQDGSPNVNNSAWPLLDYPGWKIVIVFQFLRTPWLSSSTPSPFPLTKKSLYLGLGNNGGLHFTLGRPSIFMGLRFDTDPTAPAISDTTFKFEYVANAIAARNNTQGTVIDTAVVPVENTWYRFEMTGNAAGQVVMALAVQGASSVFTSTFASIVQSSYTSNAGGGVFGANGVAQFALSGAGTTVSAAPGTIFKITGLTGGNSVLNNTYTTVATTSTQLSGVTTFTVGNNSTGFTALYYPSFVPCIAFGNDTQGSPSAAVQLLIDFWAFVWDVSIANANAVPNADNTRYWPGS